jgi:hypothetical protein
MEVIEADSSVFTAVASSRTGLTLFERSLEKCALKESITPSQTFFSRGQEAPSGSASSPVAILPVSAASP